MSDRDPAKAEYGEYGRLVARPMLVPAVSEALETWTLPKDTLRKRGVQTIYLAFAHAPLGHKAGTRRSEPPLPHIRVCRAAE